jgi:hypothetical protein
MYLSDTICLSYFISYTNRDSNLVSDPFPIRSDIIWSIWSVSIDLSDFIWSDPIWWVCLSVGLSGPIYIRPSIHSSIQLSYFIISYTIRIPIWVRSYLIWSDLSLSIYLILSDPIWSFCFRRSIWFDLPSVSPSTHHSIHLSDTMSLILYLIQSGSRSDLSPSIWFYLIWSNLIGQLIWSIWYDLSDTVYLILSYPIRIPIQIQIHIPIRILIRFRILSPSYPIWFNLIWSDLSLSIYLILYNLIRSVQSVRRFIWSFAIYIYLPMSIYISVYLYLNLSTYLPINLIIITYTIRITIRIRIPIRISNRIPVRSRSDIISTDMICLYRTIWFYLTCSDLIGLSVGLSDPIYPSIHRSNSVILSYLILSGSRSGSRSGSDRFQSNLICLYRSIWFYLIWSDMFVLSVLWSIWSDLSTYLSTYQSNLNIHQSSYLSNHPSISPSTHLSDTMSFLFYLIRSGSRCGSGSRSNPIWSYPF